MWRAFFFAVGATLIILGGQGLVVDHLEIANGTRLPSFIAKRLKVGGQNAGQRKNAPFGPTDSNHNLAQQFPNNAQRSPAQANTGLFRQNGSLFGPSRLAESQFSNTKLPADVSYYGGVPFSNRQSGGSQTQFASGPQNQNSQFSLAGYDGRHGQAASQFGVERQRSGLSPLTLGGGGSRLVKPPEWMPWGLLAIGTLVVLYTKSIGRGFSTE